MKLHPRLTRATLELVTRFESFQAEASPAGEGRWTIGYGHTRSAREGAHISRSDAEILLFYDLNAAAYEVEAALYAPVSQREFEALTAFCFNIGTESFRRSSALARMNAGAPLEAADEIERWRHAELGSGQQVVDALVRRRAAEKAHFLGLPAGFAKSPSALVRPLPGEGGEIEAIEPPPIDPPVGPSATLHAANSVQARLRELIPDGALPPQADEAEAPRIDPPAPAPAVADAPALDPEPGPAETIEPPGETPPAHNAFTAPANDATPAFAAPPLPPPPPPPPPPTSHLPPQPAPADEVPPHAPEDGPETGLSPEAPVTAPMVPARRAVSLRQLQLALVALGAGLLALAVMLILGGRPSLANLGLGVLGAVVMTPGVYGLLGPRPETV